MPGLVVVALWVWLGFVVVRLSGVGLRVEERLVVAPVAGLALGSWALYLMAWALGRLSWWLVAAQAIVIALAAAYAWRRRPTRPSGRPPRWFVGLAAVLLGALLFMNLWGVLAPAQQGNVVAAEHVWADTPFHAGIITSFAHRPNYPPTYPMALGEPLGYPFLIDFVSGVLVWGGLGLRAGIIVPNLIVQVGFFLAVALLTRRLTRSAPAAVVATGVLFCLGNLGYLSVPGDISAAGGVGPWIGDLPWSYTGDALGDKGLERLGTGVYLGNPTFMFFLPRRSAAFGLAVAFVLLLLLDELLERRRLPTAILAGLVLGVMPRVHAHSLIALVVFIAAWCLLMPARRGATSWADWRSEWRAAAPTWAVAGGVALIIGGPQVLSMMNQASGFTDIWFGWTGEPHKAFEAVFAVQGAARLTELGRAVWTTARFWFYNGGVLLLLAIPAWRSARRRLRFFYLPVALLWVFGNVVRTQPWEWDNNNYFLYWQIGTAMLVAPWLAGIWKARPPRASWAGPAAAGVLVVLMTVGGLLSFVYAAQQRHHLWTPREVVFAADVRRATGPQDAVLTANGHGHPVIALSGRQTFMGFSGWFVAHGLDWQRFEGRLQRMFRGDVSLMRRLGIDYVVIGPWEEGLASNGGFELPEAFTDPGVFRVVLDRNLDGRRWRLLELRSSSTAAPASGGGAPGRSPSPEARAP